jgi:hypothetical protein
MPVLMSGIEIVDLWICLTFRAGRHEASHIHFCGRSLFSLQIQDCGWGTGPVLTIPCVPVERSDIALRFGSHECVGCGACRLERSGTSRYACIQLHILEGHANISARDRNGTAHARWSSSAVVCSVGIERFAWLARVLLKVGLLSKVEHIRVSNCHFICSDMLESISMQWFVLKDRFLAEASTEAFSEHGTESGTIDTVALGRR